MNVSGTNIANTENRWPGSHGTAASLTAGPEPMVPQASRKRLDDGWVEDGRRTFWRCWELYGRFLVFTLMVTLKF